MRLQPETEHPHGLSDARVRRAVHRRPAGDLRLPRLPVADPPAHLPAHQPRQPPRARLQGGGHHHDAVRHGDAQRPRPLPPRHRRHRPRARRSASAPRRLRQADGRRAPARTAPTPASTATTRPTSATGPGPASCDRGAHRRTNVASGAGAVDTPHLCLGTCVDRRLDLVGADQHADAVAGCATAVRRHAELRTIVLRLARAAPLEGEWGELRARAGRRRGARRAATWLRRGSANRAGGSEAGRADSRCIGVCVRPETLMVRSDDHTDRVADPDVGDVEHRQRAAAR